MVLGIIAPTVEFSYKFMYISHGFKGPDGVGCGPATRSTVDGPVISRVVASEVHRQLGHACLMIKRIVVV